MEKNENWCYHECSIINIKNIVNRVSKISGKIERREGEMAKKYSGMWDPQVPCQQNRLTNLSGMVSGVDRVVLRRWGCKISDFGVRIFFKKKLSDKLGGQNGFLSPFNTCVPHLRLSYSFKSSKGFILLDREIIAQTIRIRFKCIAMSRTLDSHSPLGDITNTYDSQKQCNHLGSKYPR